MSERIQNGGVKQVIVTDLLHDPRYLLVKIIDKEGTGDELKRFILVKQDGKPVPTVVEEALHERYDLGPTWFWRQPNSTYARWTGEFAYFTNPKYSDKFAYNSERKA